MGQELFQHGNLEGKYIHRITRWRFVDTAARMDPSNMFTFRDLDKVAYDAETEEYYVLHKIEEVTFAPVWKLISAVEAQGEANTLYKIGTGVALNGPKVGVTLGVKSVAGTTNRIDITEDGDGTVRFNVSANFSIPFVNVTGVPAYLPASYVPPLATSTTDGTITAANFNKLAGIQAGATVNSTDAALRDRATHTGTQTASTISDLVEATQDIIGSSVVPGTDISVTYDDVLGTVTISYTGASGGAVNLGYVASPINGQVTSSAGTPATIPLVDSSNAGLMAPAQNTKLAGLNIGTGASDLVQTSQLNIRLGTTGNLGTSATANVTTSPTDTTAGRVWRVDDLVKTTSASDTSTGRMLKVGDFNIGNLSTVVIADANLVTFNTMGRTTSSTLNIPVATNGVLIHTQGFAGTYSGQIFITSTNVTYLRAMNGGSWGAWVEVWNTSTLVKTTSATDTTSGRMTKVGDFGVGTIAAGSVTVTSQDLDTWTTSGWFYMVSPTNQPSGITGGYLQHENANNSGYVKQTFTAYNSTTVRSFVRVRIATVWTGWSEVWGSLNQLDIGTTASTARTAIDSSVFPSYTVATVPAASANANKGIIVTNAASGRRPYWSNGTDWRDAANVLLS